MRMAIVTGSVSRLAGGTFSSIKRPMQEMDRQFSMALGVYGLKDRYTEADLPSWHPLAPEVFRSWWPKAYGWAPGMLAAVKRYHPELVQVHGIWMHYSVVSSSVHRELRTPYVVHLHGMLDRWAVRKSPWKKRLGRWMYEGEHLRKASCIRALCEAEVRAIREFGLQGPVCMIPNGIDLPPKRVEGPAPWEGQVEPGRKVLLFLSRIHQKKGLPNLLTAWSKLRKREPLAGEWSLVVAGWDTTGHLPELRRLVADLELSDSVKFPGPLFNEAKDRALTHADAFVLPSFSEGLPMTILEAWAFGLPVLMTPQCNLPEGFAAGAAISIDPQVSSIEEALRQLVVMSPADRAAIGSRGKDLVRERFRWDAIARQMHAVNAWVLGGGAPPESVVESPNREARS